MTQKTQANLQNLRYGDWLRAKQPMGAVTQKDVETMLRSGTTTFYRVYYHKGACVEKIDILSPIKDRGWCKCNAVKLGVEPLVTQDTILLFPVESNFTPRYIFKNFWHAYACLIQYKSALTP